MNNWKQTAAAAIVAHAPPAAAPDSDAALAAALEAALTAGWVSYADAGFARSLLSGFRQYGSFTDKQRPHVERLSAGHAEPAPVEGPDAALGARLNDALAAGNIGWKDLTFASSLQAGFKRYGSFTDRQRPHVERLIYSATAPKWQPTAPAVGDIQPPIAQPAAPAAVLCPNLCALIHLNGFARFTVGKLQLSLKNDGSVIWVKWDGRIAGSIDPTTTAYRESRRYLAAHALLLARAELQRVEADPQAAAAADGILTGRCSCCSRPLTDPVSIKLGIGPICILKF
jgi:hypothetical protein